MKILITGANSYIGMSFEQYLSAYSNYSVHTLDTMNDSWREADFFGYDVVFHVAGIAHRKETKDNAQLYYKVNRDLAVEIATRAKASNVGQFIFLSSMSVYGITSGAITKNMAMSPKSHYGKSKLQAEQCIAQMQDQHFKVCILRPPMVYGEGCKGNYVPLSKFAKKTFIFPKIQNKRSMLSIENLVKYIKRCIDDGVGGVHLPQDDEYINVSALVKKIADENNHKLWLTKAFNPIIYLLIKLKVGYAIKIFGDLYYE